MPGGNKSSHLLRVCMFKVCKVCLTINDLLLSPGIKVLMLQIFVLTDFLVFSYLIFSLCKNAKLNKF